MIPELGIIEGYFGRPWTWAQRHETVRVLAPAGYRFYLYAPKADAMLRRDWRMPLSGALLDAMRALRTECAAHGMRFGVGLSPFGAQIDFDARARDALTEKLAALDAVGIDELAILFDDMDGGPSDLARRQAEIVDFAAGRTGASRITVCPSYYSDDPLLDRAFGTRPANYLEQLAGSIDPAIGLFWTGEEVCSREISAGHLDALAQRIGRLPTLWDNYPVNDGPTMSQRLHLRGFTGRHQAIAARVRAHAINPALQPTLNRIPALTLPEAYGLGDAYGYRAATESAMRAVLGPDLAKRVVEDLKYLQDIGLDRLTDSDRALLMSRYGSDPHPGAAEIRDWLGGEYRISGEAVRTQ